MNMVESVADVAGIKWLSGWKSNTNDKKRQKMLLMSQELSGWVDEKATQMNENSKNVVEAKISLSYRYTKQKVIC